MNPILLEIGPFCIKWYAIIILTGIIVGGTLAILEAKKYNYDIDFMFDFLFGLTIFAILGARIYYVIFEWSYYSEFPSEIIKIWHGGLAIHGAIIAGLLWTIYFTKKNKISLLKFSDICVVGLIIGQAIGRWGNFMNSEAHGPATTLDFLNSLHLPEFIINGMHIDGIYYHPTFLYESIWCLIGFIILLLIRKIKKLKLGNLTSCYFIWYGIGRFLIESLRTDSLLLFNLKIAQCISILMIVVGIILLILNRNNKLYREEKNEKQV